jgi:hypothetical protein
VRPVLSRRLIAHLLPTSDAQGCPRCSSFLGGQELRVPRQKASKTRCFSPSTMPVSRGSSCRARRAQLTGEPCPSSIPRVPHSAGRVCRHIPCRRSAQHGADPDRDRVARSRTLSHAHRSTSTCFRLKSIAAHASHPSRLRDRPQAHGRSRRGGSRRGRSCRSQRGCRLRAIAGSHREIRW